MFEKLRDTVRSLTDFKRPVYDPSYDGSAWKRWTVVAVLVAICGVALLASLWPKNDVPRQANQTVVASDQQQYRVERVIDGDTVDISKNGTTERVRLIGIDTPEKNHPSKPVECFAQEASDHMTQLTADKDVTVEADTSQDSKDKYGRSLYYLFVDGSNVNERMIADGFAYEYTYNQPYKYQATFKAAQTAASSAKKGLWADAACRGERVKPTPVLSATPTPTPAAIQPQQSNCDPNYTPCIPNVSYDLDCADISFPVQVIGTDRHRFDRNGDGAGCEMN